MKPIIKNFDNVESGEGYDIYEVMDFIDKKYKFNSSDIYHSSIHYSNWCEKQGYTKKSKDSEGRDRNNSEIWYSQYKEDPEGEVLRPEYKDVIGWFINEYMPDQKVNEMHMEEEDFKEKDLPPHIEKFAKYVFAEFGSQVTLVLENEH